MPILGFAKKKKKDKRGIVAVLLVYLCTYKNHKPTKVDFLLKM